MTAAEAWSGNWSRAEIEALLARETFGYQRVPLPFNLSTDGEDRSATADLVLPRDLTGKTVVDLGCSYGLFCFEAKRRGASRVVGIDVDREVVRKARILGSILGLEVEFMVRDIEVEPLRERFDFVLALNLLHHMRDPLKVLSALGAATRHTLVLEVASLGRRDRRRLRVSRVVAWILSLHPVIVAGPSGPSFNRNVQRFYFTRGAIRNILFKQHGWFARLQFQKSPHKDRFVVKAERRRIGHLVVVTGATSSGKSTLIDRLWAGELTELAERIGMTDRSTWANPINTNHLFEDSEPAKANLIWHYDFMRPYFRTSKTYERDEALEALDCAEKLTILTIWTPPERLKQQLVVAEIERRGKKRRRPQVRHLKILRLYEDPERIAVLYRTWFAYSRRFAADHLVVTLDGTAVTLRTPSQWEEPAEPRSAVPQGTLTSQIP